MLAPVCCLFPDCRLFYVSSGPQSIWTKLDSRPEDHGMERRVTAQGVDVPLYILRGMGPKPRLHRVGTPCPWSVRGMRLVYPKCKCCAEKGDRGVRIQGKHAPSAHSLLAMECGGYPLVSIAPRTHPITPIIPQRCRVGIKTLSDVPQIPIPGACIQP